VFTIDLLSAAARVLCLGAHPDDIEIGAGASLRALRRANPNVDMQWLVFTATDERHAEAADSAARYLDDPSRLTVHGFGDGYLPYDDPVAVKSALVEHRMGFVPDVVFAPRPGDAHQDHRFVAELAWQVYRNQLILHYEIVKYEGDLGRPNLYVPLLPDDVQGKIDDLRDAFPSQVAKPWFDDETFRGLMRIRGVESNAPSGYAEAFEASKLVVR
jgi:LmbE family N-acetylglucosaminyl deacetylase